MKKQGSRRYHKIISRRVFVLQAIAAASAAALAQTGCSSPQTLDPASDNNIQTIYATCSPDCQHHVLKGTVQNGRLIAVESAPQNESKPCARGYARIELCSSKKRLGYPLLRTGKKGSGEFKTISWEEAFDLIEAKLRHALNTKGPQSVLSITGSGNFCSLTSENPMAVLMGWLGGGTRVSGNICCGAVEAALTPMLGKRFLPARNHIARADYLLIWGNNPAVTMSGYFSYYYKALENGATLCTIDPYYSETAAVSQEWLQPWPGSDSALALAMLRVIIEEGLVNKEFLLKHTTAAQLVDTVTGLPLANDASDCLCYDTKTQTMVPLDSIASSAVALSTEGTILQNSAKTVYDLIVEQAWKWDLESAQKETGIPGSDIKRVALAYARASCAMIIENMGGFTRSEWGTYAVATQVYLALFTGHIGHAGEGIYDAGGAAGLCGAGKAYQTNPQAATQESIPLSRFGEWICADRPVPLEIAWISAANIASQYPNSNSVKRALEHIPFVVTVEQFMTSTALWSDLVLPCTAVFETPNIATANRSALIQLNEAGVTPPGEAKSDLQIVGEVARRMGITGVFDRPFEEYVRRVLEPTPLAYEELALKKAVNMWDYYPDYIPYENGIFYTGNTRAKLWVQKWLDEGYWPIARHVRPTESIHNAPDAYPLAAVQRKTRHSVNSTFCSLTTMQALDGVQPPVIINTLDASQRSIEQGDHVVVFNERGEHHGIAHVTDLVKQGVVILEDGWDNPAGASASHVTNNAWPTLGNVHTCNSTLVEVRKTGD